MERGTIPPRGRGRGPRGGRSASRGGGRAGRSASREDAPPAREPRGGRSGSRETSRTREAVPVPKKSGANVEELARATADTQAPTAQRLASLQQLQRTLNMPPGRASALRSFDDVAAALLGLLQDAEPTLCSAAVGAVTAWLSGAAEASGASKKPPVAPGLDPGSRFLETLLPALQTASSVWDGPSPVKPFQLRALLLAAKECLAKASGLAAFRRAAAVFAAARRCVAAPSADGDCAAAALEALLQALKAHHLHAEDAGELADALLGRARRGDLPAAARPLLARTMHAVSSAWEGSTSGIAERQKRAMDVAEEVIQRLESLVSGSSGDEETGAAVAAALGLTACTAPLLVRGASRREQEAVETMLRLLRCFADAAPHAALPPTAVQELCGYANLFITALNKPPALPAASQPGSTPPTLLLRPAREEEAPLRAVLEIAVLQEETGMAAALANLGIGVPKSAEERVSVQITLVPDEEAQKRPASAAAALASDGDSIGQEKVHNDSSEYSSGGSGLISAEAWAALAAGVRLCCRALERPDVLGRPATLGAIAGDLLSWMTQLPREAGPLPPTVAAPLAALASPPDGTLSMLRASTNQAVVQPVARLYVALLTRLPTALQAILDYVSSSLQSGSAGWTSPELVFDVNVLLAAAKAGFPRLGTGDMDCALPIWVSLATGLLNVPEVVGDRAAALAQKVLHLARLALDQLSNDEMRRREAGRAVKLAKCMATLMPATAASMLRWQAQMILLASESDLKLVESAISDAQDTFKDLDQGVRAAALSVVAAAVGAWDHSHMLWSGDLVDPIDLLESVLPFTDDSDEKAAQKAQAIARSCALPAALAALSREDTLTPLPPSTAVKEALNPLSRSLTASQLKQVLDFAAGVAPASVLTGGRQPRKDAAPSEDWVLQMFRDVEEAAAESGAADGQERTAAFTTDLPTAWWTLLQTAAKQCVAAKLTTHWGGASQTLAALERAVVKLSEGTGAPTDGVRRAGSCLLHFIFAIEQEMEAAIVGSVDRSPCNEAAILHFYGNRKACEGWLARLRPAAASAAERLGLRHLAAYHSLRWLEALDRRARARVQPAAEKSEAVDAPSAPPERPATPMLLRRPDSAADLKKDVKELDKASPSPAAALLSGSKLQEANKAAESGTGRQRGATAAAAALASALRALHEVGEIQGAQAVLSRAFPQGSWRWLGAAALAADGHHEAALAELSALKTCPCEGSFTPASAVLKAESYVAIQDWEGLQKWISNSASTSTSASVLPAPEAAQFAYLAAWGTGQDISWPPSSSETQQTPYMAALQSLASASQRDLPGPVRRGILDAAASRAVERMLGIARASVGELDLTSQAPWTLADLAAAAALEMAAEPDRGAKTLDSLLPKSLNKCMGAFAAWTGATEPQWSTSAALESAGVLVAGAAAGGVPDASKCMISLRLAVSRAAQASGNALWAARLASAAQEGVGALGESERLDLRDAAALQALSLGLTSTESAALVLDSLALEGPNGQDSGLGAAARVGLAAALRSPDDLLSYDRGTQADAELWWRYAQHLYSTLEGAEASAAAAAAGQALVACCKAVSLSVQVNATQDSSLGTLPIMLTALRIMSDHADEVHGETVSPLGTTTPALSVSDALQAVPPLAWRPLIPCLVSALASSPSPALQTMATLALDVARGNDPAAVLLPVLAEEHRDDVSPALTAFLDRVRLEEGTLCEDLRSFVDAVAQLALLEDERWAAVLAEAQSALTKRLAAAYAHLKTLRAPEDPFTDEFVAAAEEEVQGAVAPVLSALRAHVAATVASEPSTPHQREFRDRLKLVPRLEWMVEQLAAPLALPQGDGAPAAGTLEAALQRPLRAIKAVSAEISAALKSSEISLENVCPALASLREGSVPIPGMGAGAPAVASVDPIATVLHTKTRPKKITLLGTDGKRYAFLVKGREDLRVDASVASFLGAASAALGRRGDEGVHSLSVVPVAPRAGLVAWVEGSTPLYSLYSQYEAQHTQRVAWVAAAKAAAATKAAKASKAIKPAEKGPAVDAAAAAAQKALLPRGGKSSASQAKPAPALTKTEKRKVKKAEKEAAAAAAAAAEEAAAAAAAAERPVAPAERFRSLIKAAGVKTSDPRASWPLDALRKVHLDLAATAPRSMIASELLTGAAGAAHWWSRQRAYATSTAAMSACGYLLGLGDRHLDNILLKTSSDGMSSSGSSGCAVGGSSGGVVHVDFGVLFDRGQKLGVPEIVPFRLTQSLLAGLGPTGAEGAFRRRVVAALGAARAGPAAAPLAQLLRFAVEDPLTAWAPESELRATRLAFERCTELAAFQQRGSGEGGAASAAAAAASACASLSELGPFCKIFGSAAEAVDAVRKHTATEEQSRLVLNGDLWEESRLEATAAAATDTATALESALVAAAAAVAPVEAEATAQQAKQEAVVGAALAGRLVPALCAGAERWDPIAADVPLGMVKPFGPSGLTVVGAALGLDPSTVPLGTTLLLKTATADDASREELGRRAAAIRAALDALHRYSAAVAAINAADGLYLQQGVHVRWLPALQAAKAARDPGAALPEAAGAGSGAAAVGTWRTLRAQSVAATALVGAMRSTQETLQAERVDLALAAADTRARAVEAAAAAPPPALASALAQFASSQAMAARSLRDTTPGADVLDSVQQLILGFATTVLATRDGSGQDSGWLMAAVPWLTAAVQTADSLGRLAGELQLLVPACASLFASSDAPALSDALDALAACINAACAGSADTEDDWASLAEIEAERVMKSLMDLSSRWPAISGLIQCLQAVHTTCGGGLGSVVAAPSASAAENALKRVLEATAAAGVDRATGDSLALGAAAWDALSALQEAWNDAIKPEEGPVEGLEAAWERLSRAGAGAVAAAVQSRLLPTLDAALRASAADFSGAAATIGAENNQERTATANTEQQLPSFFTLATHDSTAAAAAAGGAAPPLPEFFDFGDEEGDALGGELEDSDDFGALEEPMGLLSLEDDGPSGAVAGPAGEDAADLTPLLMACAEGSGALAAVDAVLHVTALTAQQGTQQAQRARADLAAHRWRHEAALERALKVHELHVGAGPQALGAAAPLLPSPAEAAAAALATPREELLARLRDAIAAMDAAEANIAAWKQLEGPTQVQVCEELCRIAPRATAAVRGCFQAAADWDANAAQRARTVREAATAVLDFEAARDEAAGESSGGSEGTGGRYSAAVSRVQEALKAVSTAEASAAEARAQVDALQRSRAEATEALRAAETAGAQAFVQLSKHALPLVKATQKLPGTVLDLKRQFEVLESGAGELTAVQRRLQRLLAAPTPPGAAFKDASEVRTRTEEIFKALNGAKEALRQLPAALRTLHSAAAVAKQGLAVGGRGEAAARQQAGEVVATLQNAMAALIPLLDQARAAADALGDVPSALEMVATGASNELKYLCESYGFDADAFNKDGGASVVPVALSASRCAAAPHLYPPKGGGEDEASSLQHKKFAEDVLRRYEDKVHGRVGSGMTGGGELSDTELSVEDHVDMLIREATSVDNLSRMYEGWMPWV